MLNFLCVDSLFISILSFVTSLKIILWESGRLIFSVNSMLHIFVEIQIMNAQCELKKYLAMELCSFILKQDETYLITMLHDIARYMYHLIGSAVIAVSGSGCPVNMYMIIYNQEKFNVRQLQNKSPNPCRYTRNPLMMHALFDLA